MKKITIFVIVLSLAAVIGIPLAYAIFEDYRPAIGDFFGGLLQSGTVLFTGFSSQFMTLPYWPAIFGLICLLTGIFIDRWAWGIVLGWRKKLVGEARRDSGLTTYQQEPGYQQSTTTPPAKQQTAPEEVKELEAK